MPLQVFISYKSEYREFARKLKSRIREWGYGTWFDVDDIAEGTYFRHAIQEGLEKSEVMVGVLTEDAFRSREVQAEWDYFFIKNKEFIPLRYQAVEPPYHLLTIQYIDFINDETAAFDKLHKRLGELALALQKEVVAPQKPVSSTTITTETDERGGERAEAKPAPLAIEPAAEEAALADKKRKREALDDEIVVVAPPPLRPPPKPITPAAPPAEQSATEDEERKQDVLNDGLFSPPPAPIPQPTTAPVSQPVTPPSPIPQVIGGIQAPATPPTVQPQRQSSAPPAQPASRAKSSPMIWPVAAAASIVVIGAVLLYAANANVTATVVPSGGGTSPLVWVALVAVLSVIGFGLWWRFSRRKVSAVPQQSDVYDANRAAMLNNVTEFWLKGVLEPALEAGQFKLGLAAAPGAVLRHKDYGDYELPPNADILTIFEDLNRELLILGAPGGGKTILLLQLASKLIEIARLDMTKAIPVVFNLSSWAAGRKPLAEWLTEELRQKYQVPKKVASAWIQGEKLLLLLDGLDEVTEQHRNECVDAINAFREKYRTVDLAICSRILDYDTLTSKLDLRGAVILQPLSPDVINAFLNRPELANLRQVMKIDFEIQTLSEVPFLLNALAYAYAGASVNNLQLPTSADTAKARRTHLFDLWVEKRLAASPSAEYTPRKLRQWLGWLAEKMNEFEKIVFYIEELQPSWLLKGARNKYFIYSTLAGIPIGGFAFYIIFQTDVMTVTGALLGLFYLSSTVKRTINTFEKWNWSWEESLNVKSVLRKSLWTTTLALFATIVISTSLTSGDLVRGIGSGIISIFIAILTDIVIRSLIAGGTKLETYTYPNEGILKSGRNALICLFVFFIVIYIFTSQPQVSFLYGSLGFLLGTIQGLGLSAIISHFFLRLILWRSGDAPWNYARFLDYCASAGLMRKVGGGYIFAHRYLLEYFAEMEAK